MKTPLLLGLLLLFSSITLAQQRFTISGYVEDEATGEKLPGVSIYDSRSGQSTASNTYGFYSLSLPKDSVDLVFSLIGMASKTEIFYLDKDLSLNISLNIEDLNEVVVTAEDQSEGIENQVQMSQIDIPIQQIKQLPALLGEVDVLKVIQLLPGVQAGEGNSGLYIRGGSPDQNLILLDGVPVYNVYHLFGFFSVFNADAIKSVQLTKGGYPARYGGRLSSVLDISMKEGNMKRFKGEGSIGLISSKFTFEGPIVKDKTSFIVSARRTYIDILAKPFILLAQASQGQSLAVPGYYFYDINAKINHKFNDQHRLFLSFYLGDDRFGFNFRDEQNSGGTSRELRLRYGLSWGNATGALRWNWLINKKLFANTTLTFSDYRFKIETEQREIIQNGGNTLRSLFAARYFSGIRDWTLKTDFDYLPIPQHYIRFGANATYHVFRPGALNLQVSGNIDSAFNSTVGNKPIPAAEFYAYAEDDWKISPSLRANVGVHASAFLVGGKPYYSVQPRLGLRWLLPKGLALKGSFATMTQFIHLLTNEGIGLPTDLWVPSTPSIAPEQSWQAALGLAKTIGDGYEVSIEGYYRDMRNLISYLPGASFLEANTDWESKVASGGTGQSYGAELFIQKKKGRFTGWLSYTLAWNWRQFEGTDINSGARYPFKYDRRHNIALVGIYEFSKRITASANWVYGTGNATTLPVERFLAPSPYGQFNQEIVGYGSKNNYRMAPYHRLDFSIDFHTKKPKWEYSWSFGAYNVYSRRNPFFIFADFDLRTSQRVYKQVSLFPFIPSIRWNFKF